MANLKMPKAYRAKVRSKSAIVAYLENHDSHDGYPLAWNVKAYHADMSFDNLIRVYRETDYGTARNGFLDNPEWIAAARERHAAVANDLFLNAAEVARQQVSDDDTFKQLWDGTPLAVEYSFTGRSSGWLVIEKFEGYRLSRGRYDDRENFAEWSYADLWKLYRLCLMLDHDTGGRNPDDEIEYLAAFNFVENYCSSIPKPDAVQTELAFT